MLECKKEFSNFGPPYGFSYFATRTFLRSQKYLTRRKAIEILDKEFGTIFEKYSKLPRDLRQIDESQKNIFFFWAQGTDNLPPVPKESLRRLRKYYSDYHLYLVDLKNFSNYVTIPSYIITMFNEGKITIQTFSDILRFNLLYYYGGVWADATILMYDRYPLFETIQKIGCYSINHNSVEKASYWSKVYPVTYCTFLIGTYRGSNIMHACVDFFNEYYKKHDFVIDYFMNDYMLILCMKYGIDNNMLGEIPYSEGTPFYLINVLKQDKKIDPIQCKKCPQKFDWRQSKLLLKMREY